MLRLALALVFLSVAVRAENSAPSFRNHIQPILAKSGCSMGACHGAFSGQGGFKLSLRGYDDDGDWLSLTRGAFGRRISAADPARSLLLLKATGTVPHKGGERFKVSSPDWQTLVDWIANGAPGPKADDPQMVALEIEPSHITAKPGDTPKFTARAHFSDGRCEDVTRHVKWTAVNQTVLTVDDQDNVKIMGKGESALSAWYLSRLAVATVTVPFENHVNASVFAQAPKRNWIDDHVTDKLRELDLPPSPRCSDSDFIRRAFLDTIGVLPTVEETRAFLADTAPNKRDQLIEKLLKRPEFIDYWSYKWSDLLLVTKRKMQPPAMWAYYEWIRNQVASNTPWDVFARRVLTAQGSTLENGAANYFVIHQDPREAAETTSLTFLGFSMNCAKCHNHPLEKWTNNDYYAFANLFSRVRFKAGSQAGENVVFAADDGELVQPLTGRPQAPRPLESQPLPADFSGDRRSALAAWVTDASNPYFKRTIVNRVWANFFGVGLVESIDDIRATNPASNEPLFEAAANFLAENKFNLQALMRAILQSETYQRSSEPLPGNQADSRYYSRYYPRRLMAETLHDAIAQVTMVPTTFKTQDVSTNGGKEITFPTGWRAMQLPDAGTDNYFTRAFGRPNRDQTCSCERTAEPSVSQALHVANGDTINRKLADANSCVAKALAAQKAPDEVVADAFYSALSRPPTDAERTHFDALLKDAKNDQDKRLALEDAYWALLSSREFLFNH